ncbi:MAG: anaerobic ribonucleoside-triphosphate reductase activating protein [Clostridia bacterium]|nr:anaerobic ribonucleoside-triphosphate reductase activating protein [Clostridia bacterium]
MIRGFMKMTLLDFPGKVACTVFTGGCNLRCPFCHNADIVKNPAGQNLYDEVMEYLSLRRGILEGVCISGGEPLLQPHIGEFMAEIRSMGYSIKLDTNGTLPEKLKSILEEGLCDYVAMDIKSSPQRYEKATNSEIPFEVFEKSMEVIRAFGIDHEFRTTAVKGIHTPDDFRDIAKLLLPDEKYFVQRFVDSGNLISKDPAMQAFSPEEMQNILEILSQKLSRAKLRG